MKEFKDSYGTIFNIATDEESKSLLERANTCMKEILEVLAKHNCKIEHVQSDSYFDDDRILIPLDHLSRSYISEEEEICCKNKYSKKIHSISIDFDAQTWRDAKNEAYRISQGRSK